MLSVLIAIGLVLAALTAGFNVVLGDRLDADADGVVQARASAELAVLRVGHGRISLGEAPDQGSPETQIWVFDRTRALETPSSASAADGLAAAALATSGVIRRDVAATDTRLYGLPVISTGRRLGTVVAGVSLAPYEQTRRTALIGSAILAVLAFVAVAAAANWVISGALRPVVRMTAQASDWSDRNPDRRFTLGPPRDELTQLAATLNQLLDRLAASLRREQRLSAELSHELRTPLANIAARAQFALRHTAQDDRGREALHQVIGSTRTMNRTLDTLIAAARAELNPQRVSSDAKAAAEAAAAATLPTGQRVETSIVAPREPLRVGCEQALMERILAPVIENAYRHAAGAVSITVLRDAHAIRFAVQDDGPGIASGEHEAIFEPGHRATGADPASGAGLGLALARRLARSAGGDVNAEPSDVGGRLVIQMPAG